MLGNQIALMIISLLYLFLAMTLFTETELLLFLLLGLNFRNLISRHSLIALVIDRHTLLKVAVLNYIGFLSQKSLSQRLISTDNRLVIRWKHLLLHLFI